jgi:hypothetical protein
MRQMKMSENAIETLEIVRPWSWEGNVQIAVVNHLLSMGYKIIRTANTKSRKRGRDIEANKDQTKLWISVKGFPVRTSNTPPSIQAGHWFSSVIFDILLWRGENPEVNLAVALPDFPRYRKLSQKMEWLQKPANFSFIWVSEDGTVDWTDIGD